MDGDFRSWTASGEHGHIVADNTPWGEAFYNINDESSQNGNFITEAIHEERWDGDFPNACPQSLHQKVSVKQYYINFMNTKFDKALCVVPLL